MPTKSATQQGVLKASSTKSKVKPRKKRTKTEAALTAKQQRFAAEYIVDLNSKQAAIRSGYNPKCAAVQGCRLLNDSRIQKVIELAIAKRSKRVELDQDRTLEILASYLEFDIRRLYRPDGSMKAIHELDDGTAKALVSVEVVEMAGAAAVGGAEAISHVPMYTKKVKFPDRVATLALAMRHHGLLKDRVEHTGKDGGPIETVSQPVDYDALRAKIAERSRPVT